MTWIFINIILFKTSLMTMSRIELTTSFKTHKVDYTYAITENN